MGQFSVEKPALTGSVLSGNQQFGENAGGRGCYCLNVGGVQIDEAEVDSDRRSGRVRLRITPWRSPCNYSSIDPKRRAPSAPILAATCSWRTPKADERFWEGPLACTPIRLKAAKASSPPPSELSPIAKQALRRRGSTMLDADWSNPDFGR
jgi:hypothetical protein